MSLTSPIPESATPKPRNYTQWSEADKAKALAAFAETGNLAVSAAVIGCPESTLRYWLSDPEAKDEVERIRSAIRTAVAWQHIENAALAAAVVRDRLINGDVHVLKDGDKVRAPVKLRDAAIAGSISIDKAMALAATFNGSAEVNDTLNKLAAALLSKIKRNEAQPIDSNANPSPLPLDASGLMG